MNDHDKTYAQHEIRFESSNSWTLYHRKPDGEWCGHYWTQIMIGHRGSIIVTGDGPDLIVRQWCDSEAHALSALQWLAGSSPNYMAEKVKAGERYSVDVDAANREITEFVKEHNADLDGDDPAWIYLCGLTRVEEAADVQRVYEEIYEITGDFEIPEFGRVISPNLLSAQAAARRLVALLRAREQQRG